MPKAGYRGLLLISGFIAIGLAIFAMITTNPLQIGPYGVTVWFLVVLAGLGCLFTAGFFGIANKLSKKPGGAAIFPAARRGMLLAVWVTVLIGLSSLQQLSWRDVILTGLLIGLAEFYFGAKA